MTLKKYSDRQLTLLYFTGCRQSFSAKQIFGKTETEIVASGRRWPEGFARQLTRGGGSRHPSPNLCRKPFGVLPAIRQEVKRFFRRGLPNVARAKAGGRPLSCEAMSFPVT